MTQTIRSFICSGCNTFFRSATSDEEVNKEAAELWGLEDASTLPETEALVICDTCFEKISIQYTGN